MAPRLLSRRQARPSHGEYGSGKKRIDSMEAFHGTTILSVRRDGAVALGGDGQVTLGSVVVKATARKVRRLYNDRVLAGFAGATADAFTLFERFEAKLEAHQGQLARSAVELAKDWRADRILRRLEACSPGRPERFADHHGHGRRSTACSSRSVPACVRQQLALHDASSPDRQGV
jgi:hypothetical protein